MIHDLFRHSFEGIAIHEMIFDHKGQPADYVFLEVNPAFEEYIGLKSAEVLGKRVTEVLPGIRDSDLSERYGDIVLTKETVQFEQIFEPLQRQYRVSAYSMGGNRFTTAFEDISERKQAESELKDSRQQYQSIVENTPGVVYRCRFYKGWTMQCLSDEIVNISGFAPSELIHSNACSFASIIHPEDSGYVSDQIERTVEGAIPWEIEYRLVCKDGENRWVRERGQAVFDQECHVQNLNGLIFDITIQKYWKLRLPDSRSG